MNFYFFKKIFYFGLAILIFGDAWGFVQLKNEKEAYQVWKLQLFT